MPLNPFTKTILTKDSLLLESWIDKQIFPMDGGINRFYFDNRTKIDHLNSVVPILVKELLDAVGIEATIVTAVEIDKIYAFLVDEKNFERYKLNYIALIGDFLKSRGTVHIHWGLLKRKQFLNPLVQIVLVKKEGDTIHYFNLEEKLDSWELSDRNSFEYDLEHMHWSRSNEIETAEAIE